MAVFDEGTLRAAGRADPSRPAGGGTMMPDPRSPLELWGGVECTVNRVGDRYRDQSVLSGHHDRIGDLDLFAGLGLKALRYPVLWERTAATPDAPSQRSVRTGPGLIVLKRMLRSPNSFESDFDRFQTAAFAAE